MQEVDLRLGAEITGKPTEQLDDQVWRVETDALPPGWSAIVLRREGDNVTPGSSCDLWIFGRDVDDRTLVLSGSEQGRLAVTDRMRPRYIQGLRDALAFLRGETAAVEIKESLSELKGMVNRCVRKEQSDWLTVYNHFGQPPQPELLKIRDVVSSLARAARDEELDASRFRQHANDVDLRGLFERALDSITESAPRLDGGRPVPDKSDGDGSIDDSTSSLDGEETQHGDSESTVLFSRRSREKMRRANRLHQETLAKLAASLRKRGHLVDEGQLIDAFAHLKSGPAIFEVKSLRKDKDHDNEREQVRSALSQLYEYRFLHEQHDATLWVVFSQPLSASHQWLIEYLREDRGVGVLWVEDDELQGPDRSRLTASGSEAKKLS